MDSRLSKIRRIVLMIGSEKLEALVRFELTTSRFVILRSDSVELQSRRIKFGGRPGLAPRMRDKRAAVFKTAATPIWLAFHKIGRTALRERAGKNL